VGESVMSVRLRTPWPERELAGNRTKCTNRRHSVGVGPRCVRHRFFVGEFASVASGDRLDAVEIAAQLAHLLQDRHDDPR
jgi:hypothetical protein